MSSIIKYNKISNLGEFVVLRKELRKAKNNSDYIKMIVRNEFSNFWVYCYKNSDYYFSKINFRDRISIKGFFYTYNGYEMIKAVKINKMSETDKFLNKLYKLADLIKKEDCRMILDTFLNNKSFIDKFTTSPASLNSHHSFKGGLLYHTVNSMELGLKFYETEAYKGKINLDILLTGLFLHDIGKIFCYKNGKLTELALKMGHVIIGEKYFWSVVDKLKNKIKLGKLIDLSHIILSHHSPTFNKANYPSITIPQSNEAILVNKIESLDAWIDEYNLKVI